MPLLTLAVSIDVSSQLASQVVMRVKSGLTVVITVIVIYAGEVGVVLVVCACVSVCLYRSEKLQSRN